METKASNQKQKQKHIEAKQNLLHLMETIPDSKIDSKLSRLINKVIQGRSNKKHRKVLEKMVKDILANDNNVPEPSDPELKICKVSTDSDRLPYTDIRISAGNQMSCPIPMLVDTGSEINIVKYKEIKSLVPYKEITPISNLVLSTASGKTDRSLVIGEVKLDVMFLSEKGIYVHRRVPLVVVKDSIPLNYGILGMPFIDDANANVGSTNGRRHMTGDFTTNEGKTLSTVIPCRRRNEYTVHCLLKPIKEGTYNCQISDDQPVKTGDYHISGPEAGIPISRDTYHIRTIQNVNLDVPAVEFGQFLINLPEMKEKSDKTPLTLTACEPECHVCGNEHLLPISEQAGKEAALNLLETTSDYESAEEGDLVEEAPPKIYQRSPEPCLCQNSFIKWNIPQKEIDKFTSDCSCQKSKQVHNVEENTHPLPTEFSDDPVTPSAEEVGDEILARRDIMNTTSVNNSSMETDVSHLSKSQQENLQEVISNYSEAIQTPTNLLGRFRYFQASFDVDDPQDANQKNRNINFSRSPEAEKKVKELMDLGVVEPSRAAKTKFNFVLVKKFAGLRQQSKADRHLAGRQNNHEVKWRLATDCSDLNKHLINIPTIILPRAEDIKQKVRNSIFSNLDIADQYFNIEYDEVSRTYANVYYKDAVIQFNRVLQGLASSPYHAQCAMALTFHPSIFKEWRQKQKFSDEEFPYTDFSQFVSYYLDDIITYTSMSLGFDCHLKALDSIFYAIQRAGWVVSLKKCNFFSPSIKWLGININAAEGTAEVDFERAAAIINMRAPRSVAEASSRVSLILYNASFLPYLKKLVLPIHDMVRSAKFEWNETHAHVYSEIKLLISLGIKNTIFSPDRELIIEGDSSKLAVGASIW